MQKPQNYKIATVEHDEASDPEFLHVRMDQKALSDNFTGIDSTYKPIYIYENDLITLDNDTDNNRNVIYTDAIRTCLFIALKNEQNKTCIMHLDAYTHEDTIKNFVNGSNNITIACNVPLKDMEQFKELAFLTKKEIQLQKEELEKFYKDNRHQMPYSLLLRNPNYNITMYNLYSVLLYAKNNNIRINIEYTNEDRTAHAFYNIDDQITVMSVLHPDRYSTPVPSNCSKLSQSYYGSFKNYHSSFNDYVQYVNRQEKLRTILPREQNLTTIPSREQNLTTITQEAETKQRLQKPPTANASIFNCCLNKSRGKTR